MQSHDNTASLGDVLKNLSFVAITIGVAYWVTVKFGIDNVRAAAEEAGIMAPLLIILLKATTLVVVPLGGTPLYPLAGALFGFWKGLFITIIGDILGSTTAFYLSRRFGRTILRFFMPAQHMPTVEQLVLKMADRKTFLKAKLFFAGFPELFAYAAGLTAIPYFYFIAIHMGVHVFGASLLVIFGDALVSGGAAKAVPISIAFGALALLGVWKFKRDIVEEA